MVRNYKKKTERTLPSPRKLKRGLELLKNGYSLRTAAKECGINYGCLNRLHKKTKYVQTGSVNDLPDEVLKISHNSRSVFSEELEASIADYCKEMAMIGYGLTVKKVCELGYETAVENRKINPDLKIPVSWEKNNRAGSDWFQGFMKRHPTLSVRTPEGCSLARAAAFNKATVSAFSDKLHACLQRHPSFADGSRMGNLDETANSTVQNTRKLVSPKGIKQVHQIKTAERGVSVTTCCTVTAHGSVIPPVMIFPRKKFISAMMINAYPGSLGLANDKGYMTKETFVEVLKHVIKHTAATKDNPFLLLVDNVETHLSVESLTLAKDHGVTMLTFPPHCTHKLQPLDLSLFGPFKTYYDDAVSSWLLQNPGQSITIYHIAGFVKTALMRAGTVENITAGFAKAGIMPFDRHTFPDSEFIMSSVTHRIDPTSQVEVLAVVPISEAEVSTTLNTNDSVVHEEQEPLLEPSTSSIPNPGRSEASFSGDSLGDRSSSSASFISPKEFKGLPKAKETAPKRKPRRKGKCCIATDTPEKNEVEQRQRAREEAARKTENNKRKRAEKKEQREKAKQKKKKVTAARALDFSDNDASDIDGDLEPIGRSKRDSIILNEVPRPPTEGEFVLVLFPCKGNTYYVGKVIKNIDDDGDCEISFYRLSSKAKDRFVLPNIPDLCSVHISDIKTILPKPTSHPALTKRQQSYIGFDFNFGSLKLG